MNHNYSLVGDWDETSTVLYMKGMFCREINFLNISDDSILYLKEFSRLGSPFNLYDCNRIYDGFKNDFISDPINFLKQFLKELSMIEWPRESVNIFMSSLLAVPIKNGFQILLTRLIRHYLGNKCDVDFNGFEFIEKIEINYIDVRFFIDNKIIIEDEEQRILMVLYYLSDNYFSNKYFPPVYVSESYLRNEEQGEILINIHPNISIVLKSLTLKYDEINSFQRLIDILYCDLLINKIGRYTYGIDWILSKYNGVHFTQIEKLNQDDLRSLKEVGVNKNDILFLQKI